MPDAFETLIAQLPLVGEQLARAEVQHELLALVLAGVLALVAHHLARRALTRRAEATRQGSLHHLAIRSLQRVLWPVSMLVVVFVARIALQARPQATPVLDVAVPLLTSLATIRIGVYLLRKGFRVTRALKAWENLFVIGIWSAVALHLLGWLPAVAAALDAVAFTMGETRISLLATIKLFGLIALLLTLAFWISGVIERRMRASPNMTPSLQVAFAKFARVFLIALAFLVAIDAVGIDLTTFAVFGGALGVGIGFGLQRITSNFISGFILVLDRSIKPGDVISVGTDGSKYGWVQELRARYVVVRDRDGVERLIPNENLITSEVINWSYTDKNTRIRLPVQISYDDDPEQAIALLEAAAQASPRVLGDPVPTARLLAFGDNGIELELRVWIADPENGIGNVRTDINLAIWRAFKAAGITIPYPQRDVHLKPAPPGRALPDLDPNP
ncbi:mechanosensitive ion channel [Nitrogeniibacter mangrovi]|uniref:Mechanosensitive ion channel n=1 Tax=Nitrogeniibacter mangrovi TaxID=2016596 RepID=A0A6C1B0Z9_9RHOO|nr:mechanosensitive ion channel domain-containing protein [Nitrogeniibacter mangrovi]QID17247.1 mechanosensitive ion channel [Nitrogeniibacter mangrovi]